METRVLGSPYLRKLPCDFNDCNYTVNPKPFNPKPLNHKPSNPNYHVAPMIVITLLWGTPSVVRSPSSNLSGFGFRVKGFKGVIDNPIMKNEIGKSMEHEMETGIV